MNIAKQLIDNQVRNLVRDMPDFFAGMEPSHQLATAFTLIGVATYLNIDIESACRYLTDGGGDGGIDAAYIDQNGGDLQVVLFQAKYVQNLDKDAAFPTNAIESAVSTVRKIFDPDVVLHLNEKSQAVVDEIHSLINSGEIPHVIFVCMNNGVCWNEDGQRVIDREFAGQKQVDFTYYNCEDMVASDAQKQKQQVDLQLTGPATKEDFNYKSVLVGRVSILEIDRLMKTYGDSILQKNIRYYLGNSKVNNSIRDTLEDSEDNANFFFYNNGITIVCDKFDANYLQKENWRVKLDNAQIINGGQTCKTIESVFSGNPDVNAENAFVLVRIYQLDPADTETIRKITVATNSQNAVDLRDLRANDEHQQLLTKGAAQLGYTYKHKRDSMKGDAMTIPSTVCAEAVFTVWRQKPFLAKYHKSELFDKYYSEIFDDLNAAQMIIAVLIFRYCDTERRKTSENPEADIIRRYDNYLIAALFGARLLKQEGIQLAGLDHRNFERLRSSVEASSAVIYDASENTILEVLHEYFAYLNKPLAEIDGRTLASAFRSEEFFGRCMRKI